MTSEKTVILDSIEIEHKIRRIAYQIYEANSNEDIIVIAGIVENGFTLAKKIKTVLESISPIKTKLCKVSINKENPLDMISTDLDPENYKNHSLVLVDDVLNSGSTLMYGVKHFLDVPLKRLKTAILVNRNHKKYPVKADFKGLSLSTSMKERVEVVFDGKDSFAYLI